MFVVWIYIFLLKKVAIWQTLYGPNRIMHTGFVFSLKWFCSSWSPPGISGSVWDGSASLLNVKSIVVDQKVYEELSPIWSCTRALTWTRSSWWITIIRAEDVWSRTRCLIRSALQSDISTGADPITLLRHRVRVRKRSSPVRPLHLLLLVFISPVLCVRTSLQGTTMVSVPVKAARVSSEEVSRRIWCTRATGRRTASLTKWRATDASTAGCKSASK